MACHDPVEARQLIHALRLADVGEWFQYRCIDGVMHWRRGHAAGCALLSAIWLHRLLAAPCELLGHTLRVEFAPLRVLLRALMANTAYPPFFGVEASM